MAEEQVRYIDAGDVGPGETFRDLDGREYDEEHVRDLVEEVRRDVARRGGRPSLTGAGVSPQVQIRVSPQLKHAIDAAAAADHTSRAEWMRRVLRRAVARQLGK